MIFFFPAVAFVVGAIIGSFLNVVIHRYPIEESVVFPPSRCPHCRSRIRPWHNVPILSWLLLRGRCYDCKAGIDARYPLVELANAIFYTAIILRTGPTPAFLILAALVSATIVLIFIDLDIQILPDVIDLPGVALGLIAGAMHLGALHPEFILSRTLFESITGAIVGSGALLAISLSYQLVRKVEGMGLGDVKMAAMLGAVLGWEPLLALFLIASVSGAVVGLAVARRTQEGMQTALPFGVFLGLAFLIVLFFGNEIFLVYDRMLAR
jgi:leader peptidase (prepilin peptidase)/N-methyltransferase